MTDIVATNPAVAGTSPFWFGVMSLSHAGMPSARRLAWYAIDVERPAIDVPGLKENLYKLRDVRRILFDRDSRPYFGDLAEVVDRGEEVPIAGPARHRQLLREMFVVGTVSIGPNVVNDGAVVMSEGTMAEVFGSWYADRPAFIGIQLVPGADPIDDPRRSSTRRLSGRGEVITRAEFEAREKTYWSRETPVGYITDLGFVMGLMIGMVFIYYAQYQIIRFYLPEYAILKSLGYDWWFFLCMIGQIGAAIITPAFLVAFTLARAGLRRRRGDDPSRHDHGPARDGGGAGGVAGDDRGVERLRDPAPVEGRPDHAVRVTMVETATSWARRRRGGRHPSPLRRGPAAGRRPVRHQHAGPRGRAGDRHRPVGLGQDDPAHHPRHHAPAVGRQAAAARHRHRGPSSGRARRAAQPHPLPVPEAQPAVVADGAAERHRRRLDDAARRSGLGREAGAPSARPARPGGQGAMPGPTSCRAASSSASRSRA